MHDGLRVVAATLTLAVAGAAQAPFAAPQPFAATTANGTAALIDCNRDGSRDVLTLAWVHTAGGIVEPVGGTSSGGSLVAALAEHGRPLAVDGPGPALPLDPDTGLPVAAGMGEGDLDGDGREDLVTVGIDGLVTVHRNLGGSLHGGSDFQAGVDIADITWLNAPPPPQTWLRTPLVRVADLDGDSSADILVAGAIYLRGPGPVITSYLTIHRGNAAGGYVETRLPVAGAIVDAALGDLDRDGDVDGIVAVVESGAPGAYVYELRHYRLASGGLQPFGLGMQVGVGRISALALADVNDDGLQDYVLADNVWSPGGVAGSLLWYAGNGQGQLYAGAWGTITLPGPTSSLGTPIVGLVVGDWNHDGHDDVAALRAAATSVMTQLGVQTTRGASEVLVAMGPSLQFAAATAIALPGEHEAQCLTVPPTMQTPLELLPGQLRSIDLKGGGACDLLVLGMQHAGAPAMATLTNTTPHVPGAPRLEALGAGTGGNPAYAARLGFDGGAPRLGNSQFRCTVQNFQGGCLAGLLWGTYGQADLFTVHGFTMHLVPTEYFTATLASGSGPGEGFATYALPIPNVPALVGEMGSFQYVYYDHVTGAFGGSQATSLWIGQ